MRVLIVHLADGGRTRTEAVPMERFMAVVIELENGTTIEVAQARSGNEKLPDRVMIRTQGELVILPIAGNVIHAKGSRFGEDHG